MSKENQQRHHEPILTGYVSEMSKRDVWFLMYRNVKVYGKDADKLETGEKFKTVKYSIEGRTVVEFVPLEEFCETCGEYLKRIDIGHDDYDYICSNEKCSEHTLL
jgi:hypothetical protein